MNYTVKLKDGVIITLENIERIESDGSGSRFFQQVTNENDEPVTKLVATFYAGQVVAAYPSGSVTETEE